VSDPVAPPQSQPLKAAFWMTGAVVSFTSMAVAGREVSVELDTFEIMLYRSLIGMVLVVAIARMAGTLGQVTLRRLGLHALRNLSHFAGQNLWFYAVALIPLAQLFAFEFSVPIWVALAAPLFLSERLTRMRLAAALLGFLGILLVARPGAAPLTPGLVAAMLCAIGFAGSAIATKLLTRTETITCILFWLTVMQSVLGLLFAGVDGDIALPSAAALPWVVLVACAGLFAHFCLTTALRLAPAVVVMPLDFSRLPIVAVLGMLLYAEPLDPMVFLGAAVIFGANYLNIVTESRGARARPVHGPSR
jgi:drug/metabolite transporter (DMT)-like permease